MSQAYSPEDWSRDCNGREDCDCVRCCEHTMERKEKQMTDFYAMTYDQKNGFQKSIKDPGNKDKNDASWKGLFKQEGIGDNYQEIYQSDKDTANFGMTVYMVDEENNAKWYAAVELVFFDYCEIVFLKEKTDYIDLMMKIVPASVAINNTSYLMDRELDRDLRIKRNVS